MNPWPTRDDYTDEELERILDELDAQADTKEKEAWLYDYETNQPTNDDQP